jgi:GAF domain-containing protein
VHIEDTVLAGAMGRLSQHELSRMGLRDALGVIVGAMPALFDVDGAGVLLLDDRQDLRHVASTDSGAQILEALQETTGRGPCVAALINDEVIMVDDVATDERWPELRPVLVENGIRGVLGVPVHVAGTAVGSLNVYHREAHDWDRSDVDALMAFDQVVERLLSTAVLSTRNEQLVSQLERALAARISIDRAVGMLMGMEDLDATEAFERIRRSARAARRPIREVAGEMLGTRKLP